MGGFTVSEFALLSRKEAANAREADNLVQAGAPGLAGSLLHSGTTLTIEVAGVIISGKFRATDLGRTTSTDFVFRRLKEALSVRE